MSKFKSVFKRVEKKYLLSDEIFERLMKELTPYMQIDEYGLHTICNIYYDTEQYDLIRHSIEKPAYKEKLRVRSYGVPSVGDNVFVEIKKKYDGIVYKRRIAMELSKVEAFLEGTTITEDLTQIEKELQYFIQFYQPRPKQYIAYDRIAMFGKEDPEVRITFDQNIRSRGEDLYLEHGDYGEALLKQGEHLMEIKIGGAMPMWLARILSELEIYPTSFSKYGNIYKRLYVNVQGGSVYV